MRQLRTPNRSSVGEMDPKKERGKHEETISKKSCNNWNA